MKSKNFWQAAAVIVAIIGLFKISGNIYNSTKQTDSSTNSPKIKNETGDVNINGNDNNINSFNTYTTQITNPPIISSDFNKLVGFEGTNNKDKIYRNILLSYPNNINIFIPLLHTDTFIYFAICNNDHTVCSIPPMYQYSIDKETILCYKVIFKDWNGPGLFTKIPSENSSKSECL